MNIDLGLWVQKTRIWQFISFLALSYMLIVSETLPKSHPFITSSFLKGNRLSKEVEDDDNLPDSKNPGTIPRLIQVSAQFS